MHSQSLPKVTVVDALMGSGKTTLVIRKMTEIAVSFENLFEDGAHRFIYITPFLEEVERVKKALNEDPEIAGSGAGRNVVFDPVPEGGRKLSGLNRLLAEGQNIVATHALFKHVDEATGEALENYRYTLFVDEVAEWVERYEISTQDLRMLFDSGRLKVNRETKRVDWVDPPEGYRGKFDSLRSLCLQGKIVASRFAPNEDIPVLLLWQMPTEFLAHFERVYIFTHLFEGSDMSAYLRLHGVEVEKASIGQDGTMVPYDPAIEAERVERIKHLVEIEEDPALNAVGRKTGRSNPLSKGWFDADRRNGEIGATKLARATRNFFVHRCGTPSGSNLWSTFNKFRKALQGSGYARSFLACNARATNDYRDRVSLAYLVNLYRHPFIRGHFEDHGVATSDDFYALGTLTQWIWRSAIRDGKPIKVFIPSERMRGLLRDWLEGRLPDLDGTGEGAPDTTVFAAEPDDIEEARDDEPEYA
ncbi:MAG: hypothetical protein M9907_15335 [Burkholderiaceae bacterium]|nr:hypothetical protein [Burkholderiaceae bacterium]